MKITVINGSHRINSQSLKVAKHIENTLQTSIGIDADILSLEGNPLPLWDQGTWEGEDKWQTLLTPLNEQLAGSDGFVVISPEWHGQVPSGLKNFFLLFGKDVLGHKPALIVTVSSGTGGSYPVAELRMSSYKNNRICYIPEHVIIRDVENVLNEEGNNNEKSDAFYRERIKWSLDVLKEYATALTAVRVTGITNNDQFKNGM